MFNLCLEWMCKGYIYAEVGAYSATTPEQKASVERRKKEIGPLILEKLHVHAHWAQWYTEGLRGSLENRNSYDNKTKLLVSILKRNIIFKFRVSIR